MATPGETMMRDGNQLPAVPAGFTTATSDPTVSPRRSLILAPLLAPLLAAAAVGLADQPALAAKLDPAETQVTLPGAIKWTAWTSGPPHSGEMATLHGDLNAAAQYVVLMKWYPGYMSAPHTYATDRLSLVLSGTWWVNSGADFDPNNTVPVPAGGFVRRVAHTPHYDGVKRGGREPAVIALFGMGPVDFALVDPSKPAWRRV
jgi:hypothetical protein